MLAVLLTPWYAATVVTTYAVVAVLDTVQTLRSAL